ncbi:MAG: universal stress protein [bacterium]|nr:universal stress protein [bacterium]
MYSLSKCFDYRQKLYSLNKYLKKDSWLEQEVERIIIEGQPSEKIIEIVEKESIDVVVMGSHGHTGMEKAFLGSVSKEVIKGTKCPVLLVK